LKLKINDRDKKAKAPKDVEAFIKENQTFELDNLWKQFLNTTFVSTINIIY